MTVTIAVILVVLGLAVIGLCVALVRRNDDVEAALDELYLWRTHCDATARWLANFPDATDALAYLKAKASGDDHADMVRTREMMHCRRTGTRISTDH